MLRLMEITMTKLADKQLKILLAAADREDGAA
jgi:hypothetical protein